MEHENGTLCIHAKVEGLTCPEVMESLRRLMVKPYLILWAVVYGIVAVYMIVTGNITAMNLCCPAVILLLLWGAYEFSGRKNFDKMAYGETVMEYTLTPKGFELRVGDQTGQVNWTEGWIRESKHDLLLYSGKNNCSILPKRCLEPGHREKILSWVTQKE